MPGPTALDPKLISLHLQAAGPLAANDLATRLKVSRPTIHRAVQGLGDAVLKLGITRHTRYALKRSLAGRTRPFSIYRLNLQGRRAIEWANLTALHGGWHLDWPRPG